MLAMGGEGGGVLADWIVDLASTAATSRRSTSVPGVAQRTGATIYYLELFPEAAAEAAGRLPVLALMPVPGDVDVVIASELMEAGRAVQRGLVTPDRTTLIASTHRVYAIAEKVAMADGRVEDPALRRCLPHGGAALRRLRHGRDRGSHWKRHQRRDVRSAGGHRRAAVLRERISRPPSSGRAWASPRRSAPFRRGSIRAATRRTRRCPAPRLGRLKPTAEEILAPALAPPNPIQQAEAELPAEAMSIVRAGVERLVDYQDDGYARHYVHRLTSIAEADRKHGDGTWRLIGGRAAPGAGHRL